ncbi:MAG: hypothetical protein JSS50_01440 [Proteobacteria bacterium]|nr:hypothetical protein [Pseudomonadota bacterium]
MTGFLGITCFALLRLPIIFAPAQIITLAIPHASYFINLARHAIAYRYSACYILSRTDIAISITYMLTHTQIASKLAPRNSLRPQTNSEHIEVQHQIEIEHEKNMWTARYIAVGEVIMVALTILVLIGTYLRHDRLQSDIVESLFIACTFMIVSAAYLWHLTSDFFTELKRKRPVRK